MREKAEAEGFFYKHISACIICTTVVLHVFTFFVIFIFRLLKGK